MLRGWLREGTLDANDCIIVSRNAEKVAEFTKMGVAHYSHIPSDCGPEIVLLAVKPYTLAEVLPACRALVSPNTVFVSVAAGKSLAFFAQQLGQEAAVIRTMPNTPTALGQGVTGLVANNQVSEKQRQQTEKLMTALGLAVWLEQEQQMHALTALSGCGPAYVFLLIEAMAAAGTKLGLPTAMALELAKHTVAGAGQLAIKAQEQPAQLREAVSSPGGLTLEALKVLMTDGSLPALIQKAMDAAVTRSEEVAKEDS